MLDKLNIYCKRWNLKVNVEKTKVMIFEKGRKTIADIYFDDEKLELIQAFKYLGLTFFKNGKWLRSQKIISQYDNFASHTLKCLLQNVYLNVNEKIKLFDSLVLNYASEVWGYDDCKDIEIVHNKFCRYLLGVKKSTNIAAMYGELGRMPLRVVRKLRMLKYWIRILENSNENPFVYKIYEMMYNDVIQGRYRVMYNWAFQIKCCTSNSIESEYHFLLVCPLYTDLRRKYLPRFCWSFINIDKFKCLMGNDTERSYLKTGKFIYYAANRREEFLSNF